MGFKCAINQCQSTNSSLFRAPTPGLFRVWKETRGEFNISISGEPVMCQNPMHQLSIVNKQSFQRRYTIHGNKFV